jgi:hypothetical protein
MMATGHPPRDSSLDCFFNAPQVQSIFDKAEAVVSETALELITIFVCRSEAVKIAFGLLDPPDQFLLFKSESIFDPESLCLCPDLLYFHFHPLSLNCFPIQAVCQEHSSAQGEAF